jgi:hypothetical protein
MRLPDMYMTAEWPSLPIENRFESLPDVPKLNKAHREWVYFVQCEPSPCLIKIGHSHDVKARLVSLQNSSPIQLKLIGLVQGPAGTEFALHKIFDKFRVIGEWFTPNEQLASVIAALPRGGSLEGIELKTIADKMECDFEDVLRHLWLGTRRKGRKGFKVADPLPMRRLRYESLILGGYFPEWKLRPSARKKLKELKISKLPSQR